jgi:hypothetical protein
MLVIMTSPPLWTAPTVDRRDDSPAGTERESLDTFLDWHRETLREYARHGGHADLLREAIDGVTGE